MRAGQLDRRITIETPTGTQDTFGEFTETWATFATEWAQYEPLKGREQLDAMQVNADLQARFRIRYRSDITTKMRIVNDDSLTYGIEAITQIGRREGLEILARVATGA